VRTVKATAAAVTAALAAGAAGIVAGRIASDAGLKAPPGRPLPGEPRLTVHATAAGRIALTRDLAALRPGTYGLAGDASHAVVGDVLTAEPHSADTVVRRLERVTHGTLAPGDKVWLTPNAYVGDPRSALGLDHTDVDIPGVSKWSYNLVALYEKGPVSARLAYNYRSRRAVADSVGGITGLEMYEAPQKYIDASVSYKFAKQLEVFLNGTNLTNEYQRYYLTWSNQPGHSTFSERMFMLGIRGQW